jgi:hypothetical protein
MPTIAAKDAMTRKAYAHIRLAQSKVFEKNLEAAMDAMTAALKTIPDSLPEDAQMITTLAVITVGDKVARLLAAVAAANAVGEASLTGNGTVN